MCSSLPLFSVDGTLSPSDRVGLTDELIYFDNVISFIFTTFSGFYARVIVVGSSLICVIKTVVQENHIALFLFW